MDRFENAVLLLSCGRVKTELFENADVTASIYNVSEHVHGSLGIMRGYFACLFSFIEGQASMFACTASSCGRGYFRKSSSFVQ